jgi:hypothetical protein
VADQFGLRVTCLEASFAGLFDKGFVEGLQGVAFAASEVPGIGKIETL